MNVNKETILRQIQQERELVDANPGNTHYLSNRLYNTLNILERLAKHLPDTEPQQDKAENNVKHG